MSLEQSEQVILLDPLDDAERRENIRRKNMEKSALRYVPHLMVILEYKNECHLILDDIPNIFQ